MSTKIVGAVGALGAVAAGGVFALTGQARSAAPHALAISAANPVLQSLYARIDRGAVRSVVLGPAESKYGSGPSVQAVAHSVDPTDVGGQVGMFQALLVEADLAAVLGGASAGHPAVQTAAGLRRLVSVGHVTVTAADGTQSTVSTGLAPYLGAYNNSTAGDVETAINSAAAANGLTVENVKVLHVLDDAAMVTVSVPSASLDASTLEEKLGPEFTALVSPSNGPPLEGLLITVVSNGKTVAYSYNIPRAGVGGHWVSSALAGGGDNLGER